MTVGTAPGLHCLVSISVSLVSEQLSESVTGMTGQFGLDEVFGHATGHAGVAPQASKRAYVRLKASSRSNCSIAARLSLRWAGRQIADRDVAAEPMGQQDQPNQ